MRILVTLAILAMFTATSALAFPGGERVTICHETGSESNPTVLITIARQAWENGHSIHTRHHGDHLGPPCSGETTESTPTPTTTPNATPVSSGVDQEPIIPLALPNSGGAPE